MIAPFRFLVLVAVALLPAAAPAQDNAVYAWSNFAGQPGSPGTNDAPASAARFNLPGAVAADGLGNLLVADTANSTIRKITPAGAVTTLAGSPGNPGTDDGLGTIARFYLPNGVAADNAGNVYVADTWSHTLRHVTSSGFVTTLAGSAGSSGTNDGTGGAAQFNYPTSVAVDTNGDVFVADYWNSTIRKVTSAGLVTTFAGSPGATGTNDGSGAAARFNFPSAVAVDRAGNLFVTDYGNHTIRQITAAGLVTTLAGSAGHSGTNDGPGNAARFNFPTSVAVDATGNLFVTDRLNHTIRKVSSAGVVITIGGSAGLSGASDGPGSMARFNSPYGVAVDSAGNVYVSDTYNHRISKGILLPILTIQRSGAGLVIAWPSPFTNFALQENPNPANPAGWSPSGYPITDDGTNKSITITSSVGTFFFRLASD